MKKFLVTSALFIFILNFAVADILLNFSEDNISGQILFSRSEHPQGDTAENILHRDDAGEEECRCRVRSRNIYQVFICTPDRSPSSFIKSQLHLSYGIIYKTSISTKLLKQRAPPVFINL